MTPDDIPVGESRLLHVLDGLLGRQRRIVGNPIAVSFSIAALVASCQMALAYRDGVVLNGRCVSSLCFADDLNYGFFAVVSLPVLVHFFITEREVLRWSIRAIVEDGRLTLPKATSSAAIEMSREFDRAWPWFPSVAALLTGGVLCVANFAIITAIGSSTWQVEAGQVRPSGWFFLLVVFGFYALFGYLVARSLQTFSLLRTLVRYSSISLAVDNVDGAAGLAPIGKIGLRNQYLLTVLGLNVALLSYTSQASLAGSSSFRLLAIAGVIAYLVLGPTVFVLPLVPFRAKVRAEKVALATPIAAALRREYAKLGSPEGAREASQADRERIELLKWALAEFKAIPVWPFDSRTLRRFFSAYVVPVVSAAVVALVEKSL